MKNKTNIPEGIFKPSPKKIDIYDANIPYIPYDLFKPREKRTYQVGEVVYRKFLKEVRGKEKIAYVKYGKDDWWGVYIYDELITHKATKSAARSVMNAICKAYEIGYSDGWN